MYSGPLIFKKKFFKMLGTEIRVLDQQEKVCFFVKQKAFKLKEDIRIYADEGKTQEVLVIGARQMLDFKAAYDVIDSATKEKIGALRRKGWSSLLRDTWELLDNEDQVIGNITEDSMALALIRRFVENIPIFVIPQKFQFLVGEKEAASFKQRMNPFLFQADFNVNDSSLIDPKLALAGAVLLMCIEGRQQ